MPPDPVRTELGPHSQRVFDRVGDESLPVEKALWHALEALAEIGSPNGTRRGVSEKSRAQGALAHVETVLAQEEWS